jgi:hypothetical protein
LAARRLVVMGIVLLCLGGSLAGCAVLSSETPAALLLKGEGPSGVHYYLPKRVVTLTLSVNPDTASFRLTPDDPLTIADQEHRYYLQYHPLPQYTDTQLEIDVNAKGFVTLIKSNSKDETLGILKNLAQAASTFGGGLESATVPDTEKQLSRLTIDPANANEVARAAATFNKEVRSYIATQQRRCTPDPDAGIVLDVSQYALCEAYTGAAAKTQVHIYVGLLAKSDADPFRGHPRAATQRVGKRHVETRYTQPTTADCTVGLCYRPFEPYELVLGVGSSVTRQVILLPNKSRLVEIDLYRAFFVNKTQEIDFNDDGQFTKLYITKQSELLALASLPVEILSGISDGLAVRATIIQDVQSVVDDKGALIQAQADLKKQQQAAANSAAKAHPASAASPSAVPSTAAPQAGSFFNDLKPLQ